MKQEDFEKQEALFKLLASEIRLKLLYRATEGPVAAPDLAEEDEFDITSEGILGHLKKLREEDILESNRVRGPGNRNRFEFQLSGNGRRLYFEVIPDDYEFSFDEPRLEDPK